MTLQGKITAFLGPKGKTVDFDARPPTSGVKTKINFNTEVLDPDSWYDNATNFRYTPQVAGNFLVNVQVSVSGTIGP